MLLKPAGCSPSCISLLFSPISRGLRETAYKVGNLTDYFFISTSILNICFFALLSEYYSSVNCYICNSFPAGHIHLWYKCCIRDKAEQNAHLIFAYCAKTRAHLCYLGSLSLRAGKYCAHLHTHTQSLCSCCPSAGVSCTSFCT